MRTDNRVDVDPRLQLNIDAFCGQIEQLLKHYSGKYVLFVNEKLFEVFESMAEALRSGYTNFSGEPFLVQRVEKFRPHLDLQATCRV